MAIKSGELIHIGNTTLIDRLQTAGPGNLNIPKEKILELGNYESVATIRDIADLTFTMEGLDVSPEYEAMLLGRDMGTWAAGDLVDLGTMRPIDVAGQFKLGKTSVSPYDVDAAVLVPYLTPESISYRFGLRDNASQTVSLRGDGVHYSRGSAFVEETVGAAAADQVVPFVHPPLPYNGDTLAGTRYALSVSLASGKRLALGPDYTEDATGITVLAPVPATDTIRVSYMSSDVAVYPQVSHAAASATRPAAIKGRHIEVRVGGIDVTDRWSSVQSVTVDWRVTLDRDEEMGSSQIVAQDSDVPEVTGTVEIKPRDVEEFMARMHQVTGVADGEVVGPYQSVPLPLDIVLHSPDDGAALKVLHSPDVRFTLPGYSARVNTKQTISIPFDSDGGVLQVAPGDRAA